jgi:hypothetical protein
VHLACWRVPSKVHSGLPDPDKEFSLDAFKQALLAMDEVLLKGMVCIARFPNPTSLFDAAGRVHYGRNRCID